jgi:hypothetical protein
VLAGKLEIPGHVKLYFTAAEREKLGNSYRTRTKRYSRRNG